MMQVNSTQQSAAAPEEMPSSASDVEARVNSSDGQYFKAGRSNNVSQLKETEDLIFKNGEVDLRAEFTPDGKLKCFFCPQELKQVKRHINGKHKTELQDQAALEQFCQKVAEKWKREKQSKYNESRKEKQKDYMKDYMKEYDQKRNSAEPRKEQVRVNTMKYEKTDQGKAARKMANEKHQPNLVI